MSMWSAIVMIVAIGAIASVLRARYKAQNGIIEDWEGNQSVADRKPDAAMQRELDELRKRLAVLERIATDDRQTKAIADEIENLRDK